MKSMRSFQKSIRYNLSIHKYFKRVVDKDGVRGSFWTVDEVEFQRKRSTLDVVYRSPPVRPALAVKSARVWRPQLVDGGASSSKKEKTKLQEEIIIQ